MILSVSHFKIEKKYKILRNIEGVFTLLEITKNRFIGSHDKFNLTETQKSFTLYLCNTIYPFFNLMY